MTRLIEVLPQVGKMVVRELERQGETELAVGAEPRNVSRPYGPLYSRQVFEANRWSHPARRADCQS